MARKNSQLLRKIPWVIRHAMPRLGFQRRRDGSFIYFPSRFSLTGAYEVPDAALAATAKAAHAQQRWWNGLYALAMAACVLLGALAARPASIEISATFDADRASIETALRLAGVLGGLLAVALLAALHHRIFARRHLRGFAFAPQERRAVLFRPRRSYGPRDLRRVGLGGSAAAVVAWGFHLRDFPAAYAEGGRWALVVEAQVLLLFALALGYCIFMLRFAGRVRRRRAVHADASEGWAQMEIATGNQRRGKKRTPEPRPLIWRFLFPDFGSGRAANKLELVWKFFAWPAFLLLFGILLELLARRL